MLTPSKTMDFQTPAPEFAVPTRPVFIDQATTIRAQMATYSLRELGSLLHISDELTTKVQRMYQDTVAKPAFWAYAGDVFRCVQAHTMTADSARFAQRHVVVSSAVYGLVRPFDAIQPYRLEMQTKLSVGGSNSLYDFWGAKLAQYIATYRQSELLVLSSKEYSRAIIKHLLPDITVVTPVFLDTKPDGSVSQVPIYNKMMRGVMARWVIDHRVADAIGIKSFTAHDYHYDEVESTDIAPVFRRKVMTPLVFE
ncbi:MAG: YaaA family protein [Candidatus Saccharimonadales bacterium]